MCLYQGAIFLAAFFRKREMICGAFAIIIPIFLIIVGIILIKSNIRRERITGAVFLIFVLSLIVPVITQSINFFEGAKDKSAYDDCFGALYSVAELEEKSMKEYGRYTKDAKTLSILAYQKCKEFGRDDCSIEPISKHLKIIRDRCNDAKIIVANNEKYYEVSGKAKSRGHCFICITPNGENRWRYEQCTDSLSEKCP